MSTCSTAGVASQYPYSDHEQQIDLTYPVYPEEEGEVSDRETGFSEQDSDQHISEEQTYREIVRG